MCKMEWHGLEMFFFCCFFFSGSGSHDRDSVATAADVVKEAIVLMSVHEERANVEGRGGSIQAGKC